ncbi:2-dehydropantoate 2-reductase [Xylaria sp. CBS 124048]|nr:2-dehydropantoate 2-reductase [Xylaria sp. CBS 124048]
MATRSSNDSSPTRAVHVLFVGAGAVGCFYASRLHHPTHNIYTSLTARSNYAVIASSGVSLQTHSFGNYTFRPHIVFPSVSAASPRHDSRPATPTTTTARSTPQAQAQAQAHRSPPPPPPPPVDGWDYVIVTTKALPDRSDDSALIAPLVSPRTCIVLIQNGVGVEEPYRARFPRNPIVSAVTVVSAEQTSQGVIRQNRWTRISLGPYAHGLNPTPAPAPVPVPVPVPVSGDGDGEDLGARGQACMEELAHWWRTLGDIRDVETHDEIELQTIRWHKLCINAAFNPTAVLSGGRGNAEQVRDPELRAHIIGIMEEIWEVAPKVLGRPFPASLATPDRIVKSTERNTGAKPSMLLDWEAGRPMELEVILGNPVRAARRAGVAMPRLQTVYALLKSLQRAREVESRGKL